MPQHAGFTDHTEWYLQRLLGYATRGEEMRYAGKRAVPVG
jgi:hypothetical protein